VGGVLGHRVRTGDRASPSAHLRHLVPQAQQLARHAVPTAPRPTTRCVPMTTDLAIDAGGTFILA